MKRSSYLIILIFLAILYFSCLTNGDDLIIKETFVVNKNRIDPCLDCNKQCKPDYSKLCLNTVQSCIDCKRTKTTIVPKSWLTIEKNNQEVYELSKNLNPEILVVNQLINNDNTNTKGVQPTMTNIEINAHPNFEELPFNPRNLITGMFTDTDPVPSNSMLTRVDEVDPKYKTL